MHMEDAIEPSVALQSPIAADSAFSMQMEDAIEPVVRPEPIPGFIEGEAGYPIPFLNEWLRMSDNCDLAALARLHGVDLNNSRTLYQGTLIEMVSLLDKGVLQSGQRRMNGRDETIGFKAIRGHPQPTQANSSFGGEADRRAYRRLCPCT